MKYAVLIIMIVLSIFIAGCAKHTTATSVDTTPTVETQTPAAPTDDTGMPPLPPPVPTPAPEAGQ